MRTTNGWRVLLLASIVALVPTAAWGQPMDSTNYAPEDPQFPLPLTSDRPDGGGIFVAGEFLFFHQTRPVTGQTIAVRGFVVTDNTVPDFVTGQHVGSFAPALKANDLTAESYQPGWSTVAGYRFADGTTVEASWWHLVEAKYTGAATFATPFWAGTPNQADQFLFAPAFDFSTDFVGISPKVTVPVVQPDNTIVQTPLGTAGIWNAATEMQVFFIQRFDEWNITARVPLTQTECTKTYLLFGPRLSWIWQRFIWRSVSLDISGNGGQADVAIYNNIASNRMYGVHCGCGTDCRLADTPIGTFAANLDLQVAGLFNVVNEKEEYKLADDSTSSRFNRKTYTLVPELQASLDLTYYPQGLEGVELRVGYDVMGFFNTVGAPSPVSFNVGKLDNQFQDGVFRLFDGLHAGVAFTF